MFVAQLRSIFSHFNEDSTPKAASPPRGSLSSSISEEINDLHVIVNEQEKIIDELRSRLRESQEELARALSAPSPSYSSLFSCEECVHLKGKLKYYLYLYNESEKKYDEMEKKLIGGEKECPSCLSRTQSKTPHLTWANEITHTRMISSDEEEDQYEDSDSSEDQFEEAHSFIETEKKEETVTSVASDDDDEFTLDEPF